ncbi:MAG: lytic murein transglycosylase [Solirubrobacterales bacterium]
MREKLALTFALAGFMAVAALGAGLAGAEVPAAPKTGSGATPAGQPAATGPSVVTGPSISPGGVSANDTIKAPPSGGIVSPGETETGGSTPSPVPSNSSGAPTAPSVNNTSTTGAGLAGIAPIGVPNFLIDSFEIPPFLLPIYQACGTEYDIPWEVLASINKIETAFGTNLNVSTAGAEGWMQFMPATWADWGVDANGDRRKDPYNPVDAICAAARYLRAAGGSAHLYDAIFAYNHADWYVQEVLLYARAYSRLPDALVGSLTGLTEGAHFPVAANARYADQISTSRARHDTTTGRTQLGNAAQVVSSSPGREAIDIFSRADAPVIAVNDGVIRAMGTSAALGSYIVLEDAYGNRYTYGHIGEIARVHPVPRPEKLTAADFKLVTPPADRKPTAPATDPKTAARGDSAGPAGPAVKVGTRPEHEGSLAAGAAAGAAVAGGSAGGGSTGAGPSAGVSGGSVAGSGGAQPGAGSGPAAGASQAIPNAAGGVTAPGTGASQPLGQPASTDTGGNPRNASSVRPRLYALPRRPHIRARAAQVNGGTQVRLAGYASYRNYFNDVYTGNTGNADLRPLRVGSRVIGGTILGRLAGAGESEQPHISFSIRPPGKKSPPIDPKPILDGWKLLEATAIYGANGKNSLQDQLGIGGVLLLSKEALQRRVLSDPRLSIYSCGRTDIATGQIDRRILAAMEYLVEKGYRLTITSLKCGHSFLTSSGYVSEHSSGNAMDIAVINGVVVTGHQGPGSLADSLIKSLLQLQGTMAPHQIISLEDLPGPQSFALPDHYDHVHVGYYPQYGAALGGGGTQNLSPEQWRRLIKRLGEIDNPSVPVSPPGTAVGGGQGAGGSKGSRTAGSR